jgi:hypothetical protein
MDAGRALVFLAKFFNQTAGYKILEFFISPETQHFLASAHRVAQFEICKNTLEKVVEAEHFLLGKDIAEFVGDMIRKAAGEAGTFRGDCHNDATIQHSGGKATLKMAKHHKLKLIVCKS